MKRTGFFYDALFLEHDTGDGHPERPARLRAIVENLRSEPLWEELKHSAAKDCDPRWLAEIHPPSYISAIENACKSDRRSLDSDTIICKRSFEVARRAVGSVVNACRMVVLGELDNAFCAVRPPGHHAEPERAMGFCLFNNVAVAAGYLQSQHNIERVSIIDWDVHHGNGTHAAFYSDATVHYTSLHQHPLYPGTGFENETGEGEGEGFTLNIPLAGNSGDSEYMSCFADKVVPAIREFDPEFIIISSGFDAHLRDPLAGMNVTELGFRGMTKYALELARECCDGNLVSVLEGGYNLDALASSVHTHLNSLLHD